MIHFILANLFVNADALEQGRKIVAIKFNAAGQTLNQIQVGNLIILTWSIKILLKQWKVNLLSAEMYRKIQ